jgi:hypothetical protein
MTAIRCEGSSDEQIPVPPVELNDLIFLLVPEHPVAPVGLWSRSRRDTLVWRSPPFLRANGMRWPSELGRGSQVRNRLAGGGSRIRTLGPALGTHRLGTASCRFRDPSPLPLRQKRNRLPRPGTEGSNPAPSSGESRANLKTTSTFALSSQYRSPAPAPRSAALEVLPRDADWREILAPDIHTGLSRQPATASLRSTNRLISKP